MKNIKNILRKKIRGSMKSKIHVIELKIKQAKNRSEYWPAI